MRLSYESQRCIHLLGLFPFQRLEIQLFCFSLGTELTTSFTVSAMPPLPFPSPPEPVDRNLRRSLWQGTHGADRTLGRQRYRTCRPVENSGRRHSRTHPTT